MSNVRVQLLDGSLQHLQIAPRASGHDLYALVMKKLQLLESDYFDLEYINPEGFSCWLDHEKPLSKQSSANDELVFVFAVKFYTPHPNLLEDEYTRYLFALQIKKDMYQGHLHCNDSTTALLAAYIVQADVGDFLEDEYIDHSYLSTMKFVKSPTPEFLTRVMDYHRTLISQSPAQADFNLLDTARKVELYGIRMYQAKDHEGLPLNLAVAHMGVIVFQNTTKINTFSWAKIRKLSFKRRRFLIKLHPESYGYYKDTVEFYFETRNECKNFWKQCLEHHAFFRCIATDRTQRKKNRVVSKGSSYRYVGRTEKQLMEFVRDNYTKRSNFERSASAGRLTSPSTLSRHSRLAGSTAGSGAAVLHSSASGGVGRSGVAGGHGTATSGNLSSTTYTTGNNSCYGVNHSGRSRNTSISSGSHTVDSSRERLDVGGGNHTGRSVSAGDRVIGVGGERAISQSPPTRRSRPSRKKSHDYSHSRALSLPEPDEPEDAHLVNDSEPPCREEMVDGRESEEIVSTHAEAKRAPSPPSSVVQNKHSNKSNSVGRPDHHLIGNSTHVNDLPHSHVTTYNQDNTEQELEPPILHPPMTDSFTAAATNKEMEDIPLSCSGYASPVPPSLDPCPPPFSSSPPPSASLHDETTRPDDVIAKENCRPPPDYNSVVTSPQALSSSDHRFFSPTTLPQLSNDDHLHTHHQSNTLPAQLANCNRPSTLLSGSGGYNDHEGTTIIQDDSPTLCSRTGNKGRKTRANKQPPVGPPSFYSSPPASSHLFTSSVTTRTLTTLSSMSGVSSGRSQSDGDDDLVGGGRGDVGSRPSNSDFEDRSLDGRRSSTGVEAGSVSEGGNRPSGGRRKAKYPSDRAYYLAKELLMTERTYKKDLEVLCVWLRKALLSSSSDTPRLSSTATIASNLSNNQDATSLRLFSLLDPVYEHHIGLVRALEQRVSAWEGRSPPGQHPDVHTHKVGDIFLANLKMLTLYRKYLDNLVGLLCDLEREVRNNPTFESSLRHFEMRKVCYLPVYAFLVKPMHRLLHYRLILERLVRHYPDDHPDLQDCRVAHAQLLDVIQCYKDSYRSAEQLYKLIDLQRDLLNLRPLDLPHSTGTAASSTSSLVNCSDRLASHLGPLVHSAREFVREGCLHKLDNRGYQQRMFFLFSDQLVYASRTSSPMLQFKVRGQFLLRELIVELSEPAHSFTIYTGDRCFLVAAANDWQRDLWLEDLHRSILHAKTEPIGCMEGSMEPGGGAELREEGRVGGFIGGSETGDDRSTRSTSHASDRPPDRHQLQQRTNTAVHVCWHRNVSVSMADILRTNEFQLSGYLLRKFKNSNGWQKLWVVFTNFCLFFYKSFQDDGPLASLPLLGYAVSTPEHADDIRKDHVFKLQFKTHVYFFRAESQYTFDRWYEVLNYATSGAIHARVYRLRTN